MLKQVGTFLMAVAAVVSLGACSEQLDGGKSCPLLCPAQSVTLRDTTLYAIVADTTVTGLPPIGLESYLMLSSHGDSLDTRAIVRFDTLPQTFTHSGLDSTIVSLDSAILVAPIVKPDSAHLPQGPVTIEVYDVDTPATDTVAAVLAPLFRPDRLLGSRTFAPESLVDSLRIPISTDSVLDRVRNGTRLRVGFRLVANPGYDLRFGTTQVGVPVMLHLVAATDTASSPVNVAPRSNTPVDQLFLSAPLADYTIVVSGGSATPPTILAVGGVPSRRVFIRFDVPSEIVDSTTVIRASLLLTQIPSLRVDQKDSVYIYPVPILASPAVTDVGTLLQFMGRNGQFGTDSLFIAPGDSGLRSFEIAGLVRTWRGQTAAISPRSIAIHSGAEGQLPGEFDFYSTRGPVEFRPRLRITYVPQTSYGVP